MSAYTNHFGVDIAGSTYLVQHWYISELSGHAHGICSVFK